MLVKYVEVRRLDRRTGSHTLCSSDSRHESTHLIATRTTALVDGQSVCHGSQDYTPHPSYASPGTGEVVEVVLITPDLGMHGTITKLQLAWEQTTAQSSGSGSSGRPEPLRRKHQGWELTTNHFPVEAPDADTWALVRLVGRDRDLNTQREISPNVPRRK